ncbi:MAG TPA: enolase C-terminal domain-like protein [Bryobacteraceae bacterium]|nr:enolase C-terminal domain-like protein [Bryobacteraceae bacterium]
MMNQLTRRSLLRGAVASPALFNIVSAAKPTDIRIEDIRYAYEDYIYRTPIKFGGSVLDRATIINVNCTVRTAGGKVSKGFGSMPMGNVWSFPSKTMSYETTLGAMKNLAERISKITGAYKESGHPVDINVALEPAFLKAAGEVSKQIKLDAPIPKLCTLVTASAFDAAVHDAFGKAHGLNCYRTYGPEFMTHDLSRYLGPDFKGEYLSQYVSRDPKPKMPLYHLVGAVDPLTKDDVKKPIGDGLPETLPEWIRYNGLTNLKIKLNGDQVEWDIDRVLSVDRVTTEAQKQRGVSRWVYSLDFNEKCPNVDYLLAFLRRVKEKSAGAFERIQYVEQPTARDLKAHREQDMHKAAALKPVVIDESLTDIENLMLSREMGYTGAALKACKQQSQAMLMAAVGQKHKMFLCVQDLTCPGASLIHSAGIAARVPGVAGIEANARQYFPAANKGWDQKFPGIFKITDGSMQTGVLTKPGLGAV